MAEARRPRGRMPTKVLVRVIGVPVGPERFAETWGPLVAKAQARVNAQRTAEVKP